MAQVVLPLQFAASLSGGQEVPPVATIGSGSARLAADAAGSVLQVQVVASHLRDLTQGHIHLGRPGENGPVVLWLYGLPAQRPVDLGQGALLVNRSFTAADLTGPLAGMPLSALIQQMQVGNTYVNLHTVANPGGEIRGQIVRL